MRQAAVLGALAEVGRPGLSASTIMWLVWPGTASILPASAGGQKLWMTSTEVMSSTTRWPAGMCMLVGGGDA